MSSNGAVQSAIKRTLLDGLHDDILEEGDDRAGVIAADDGAAGDDHVGPCLGREALKSGQGFLSVFITQQNHRLISNSLCESVI